MSLLHEFRRREPRLARSVLALFCLVWLQLALAPCIAAHAPEASSHRHGAPQVPGGAEAPGHAGHHGDAHATHGHDGHHGHGPAGASDGAAPGLAESTRADGPCAWCPPQVAGESCPDDSRCAFPHEPQVDARLPGLFLPPPMAPVYPAPGDLAAALPQRVDERPAPVPRRSLAVSYCRFIE
jgi:hypothetical protein